MLTGGCYIEQPFSSILFSFSIPSLGLLSIVNAKFYHRTQNRRQGGSFHVDKSTTTRLAIPRAPCVPFSLFFFPNLLFWSWSSTPSSRLSSPIPIPLPALLATPRVARSPGRQRLLPFVDYRIVGERRGCPWYRNLAPTFLILSRNGSRRACELSVGLLSVGLHKGLLGDRKTRLSSLPPPLRCFLYPPALLLLCSHMRRVSCHAVRGKPSGSRQQTRGCW